MNPFEKEVWLSLQQQAATEPRHAFIHRFAHKRFHGHPADFMLQLYLRLLMIECKSVRNPNSFECRYVGGDQISFLSSMSRNHAHGEGWLFICNRSRARRHEAYALRIEEYLELVSRIGRKSIPWTTLDSNAFYLQKTHAHGTSKPMWDLSGVLDL